MDAVRLPDANCCVRLSNPDEGADPRLVREAATRVPVQAVPRAVAKPGGASDHALG